MEAGTGYIDAMDKHSKRPRDLNQLAKSIVDEATSPGQTKKKREPEEKAPAEKLKKRQSPGSSGGVKAMGIVSP